MMVVGEEELGTEAGRFQLDVQMDMFDWELQRSYLKARWWRTLNRVMSFVGVGVIAAIVSFFDEPGFLDIQTLTFSPTGCSCCCRCQVGPSRLVWLRACQPVCITPLPLLSSCRVFFPVFEKKHSRFLVYDCSSVLFFVYTPSCLFCFLFVDILCLLRLRGGLTISLYTCPWTAWRAHAHTHICRSLSLFCCRVRVCTHHDTYPRSGFGPSFFLVSRNCALQAKAHYELYDGRGLLGFLLKKYRCDKLFLYTRGVGSDLRYCSSRSEGWRRWGEGSRWKKKVLMYRVGIEKVHMSYFAYSTLVSDTLSPIHLDESQMFSSSLLYPSAMRGQRFKRRLETRPEKRTGGRGRLAMGERVMRGGMVHSSHCQLQSAAVFSTSNIVDVSIVLWLSDYAV